MNSIHNWIMIFYYILKKRRNELDINKFIDIYLNVFSFNYDQKCFNAIDAILIGNLYYIFLE